VEEHQDELRFLAGHFYTFRKENGTYALKLTMAELLASVNFALQVWLLNQVFEVMFMVNIVFKKPTYLYSPRTASVIGGLDSSGNFL
jgi:hypothetical protein